MSWPIKGADVQNYLGVTPAAQADVAALESAAQAAVRFATRCEVAPPAHDDAPPADGGPDSCEYRDVELGAKMLAARWYGRRGSTQGVASFGEFGPAYVTRTDPDVATLMGLNMPGLA